MPTVEPTVARDDDPDYDDDIVTISSDNDDNDASDSNEGRDDDIITISSDNDDGDD